MESIKQKKAEKESQITTQKTSFAGETFHFEKELNEKDIKLMKQQEKNKTHKALDDLINDITKKKEINIFDKTKVDWKMYVDKNNLEKELDYGRKDGYLSKKRFIEEINMKQSQIKKEEERKAKYLASLKK